MISSNNQSCVIRPTLIDLNPDERNQRCCYSLCYLGYSFTVNLDRCNKSCNTVDDTSGRICVPNKMEDLL